MPRLPRSLILFIFIPIDYNENFLNFDLIPCLYMIFIVSGDNVPNFFNYEAILDSKYRNPVELGRFMDDIDQPDDNNYTTIFMVAG